MGSEKSKKSLPPESSDFLLANAYRALGEEEANWRTPFKFAPVNNFVCAHGIPLVPTRPQCYVRRVLHAIFRICAAATILVAAGCESAAHHKDTHAQQTVSRAAAQASPGPPSGIGKTPSAAAAPRLPLVP